MHRHRHDLIIQDANSKYIQKRQGRLWGQHCHDGPVQSVAAVIEDHFDRWIGNGAGAVDRDILGTDEPELLAQVFEAFCVRALDALAVGGLFYTASAGCVLGVQLESGDAVVIKAYQRRWNKPFLDAVQEAQQRLARGGMPCPSPVAPPAEIRLNFPILPSWRLGSLTRACVQVALRRLGECRLRALHSRWPSA